MGTVTGGPVEETDYRIVRLGGWGGWSNAVLSGGNYLYTNSAGGAAIIEFEGDRFDWITRTGPEFGIAAVSIDGAAPVDVDLYAATNAYQQVVFPSGPLAPGRHRITVSWTGRRNLAATGTYIGVDAIDVSGYLTQAIVRAEDGDPRLGTNVPWNGWPSAALSGGGYAYTDAYGAVVNVAFVGTSLDWIARTGPEFGIMSVSLDGGPATEINLYTPDTRYQQSVYTTGELPFGLHTLRVARTGRANPASSGKYMNLDALDVAGVLVPAAIPEAPLVTAPFNYPWSRYIVVDKSDLRLYLVENGALVVSYPVAVGKASTPTPNAVWRIGAKYYTDVWSVYGPRKMRLFRQSGSSFVFTAYNMHGTNVDSSIGTYASHGCIRMHNYDVLVFFDMVPLGTMVVTRE